MMTVAFYKKGERQNNTAKKKKKKKQHIFFSGFSSVQFSCSVVSDSATPWTAARQASLSIANSWSLLKLVRWVCDAFSGLEISF